MPQPKDKEWLSRYKNKTPIYAVYKRPTSNQGTHTDWKWRARKDISCKWRLKESRSCNIITDKIDWNKGHEKRQRRILHNDQRINPRRRYNNYLLNVRQMLTSMKGEINSNIIIVGDFNTPLTPMDRSTKQNKQGNTNFKW